MSVIALQEMLELAKAYNKVCRHTYVHCMTSDSGEVVVMFEVVTRGSRILGSCSTPVVTRTCW